MPGGVNADLRQPAMHRTVVAVFQALKVAAHFLGTPTGIAGEPGDIVPILVVRIDQNHRVVRRASAERAGARIEHTIHRFAVPRFVILGIALLQAPVGEVANEEIPLDGFVLRRESVKGGNVVIFRQAVHAGVDAIAARQFARLAACLQQHHSPAGLGQTRCYCGAAGARTHYHVFAVAIHRLTRSIRLRAAGKHKKRSGERNRCTSGLANPRANNVVRSNAAPWDFVLYPPSLWCRVRYLPADRSGSPCRPLPVWSTPRAGQSDSRLGSVAIALDRFQPYGCRLWSHGALLKDFISRW